MKIKKLNEKLNIEECFHFLRGGSISQNEYYESIKFLESLNLTDEQYSELSYIIDNYGTEKYSEGYDERRNDEGEEY